MYYRFSFFSLLRQTFGRAQDILELYDKEVEEKQVTEYPLTNIENILLNSTRLILDQSIERVRNNLTIANPIINKSTNR
ncbi:hypothetical protein [Seramator thermalis]|uniref:hypothetical protein n=1 Tax=Seramator thermalis TaxID=2496270 RepID=UPI00101D874C|nr:hypothetical protein [Seramator thermalis]